MATIAPAPPTTVPAPVTAPVTATATAKRAAAIRHAFAQLVTRAAAAMTEAPVTDVKVRKGQPQPG